MKLIDLNKTVGLDSFPNSAQTWTEYCGTLNLRPTQFQLEQGKMVYRALSSRTPPTPHQQNGPKRAPYSCILPGFYCSVI